MRRTIFKTTAAICGMAAVLFTKTLPACAAGATYYTFSQSTESSDLQVVEDAFLPAGAYLDLGIQSAQDLDVKNGCLYIADTGNKRILVVDLQKQTAREIGVGLLSQPQGVSADKEGRIYVADYANGAVYRFGPDGSLEQTFQKPDSALYGVDAAFSPMKAAPDGKGGVYIIVDGSVNGLVQMDADGTFLGYFASNDVQKSFYDKFLDIFLTEEQKKRLFPFTPNSFGNLFMGTDGLIYAVNMGTDCVIQKFNYAGQNMFAGRTDVPALDNIADICMSPDGYIYVLDSMGQITEMTDDGHMLYRFGGMAGKSVKLGTSTLPAGIGVDEDGRVYVLDKVNNLVQVYSPTETHNEVMYGLNKYREGDYEQARETFQQALKYDSTSYCAHLYLGMTYMHDGDYRGAALEFRQARAWDRYSDAYWDIRNDLLQKNLIYILLAAAAAAVAVRIWRRKYPRAEYNSYRDLDKVKTQWQQYLPGNIRRAILHPVDTAYMIREAHLGHGYAAPVLVILAGYAVLSVWRLCSGPIFSAESDEYPLFANFMLYAAAFGLFVVCHYLIVSIWDGESSLKMIVSAVSYAILPFLLTFPVFTLLNNFLTMNEQLLVSTLESAVILLCLTLLLVMLKIINDYSVRKLAASLLLTGFLAVLVILFGSLLVLLCRQIVEFVMQIYMEVMIRG